MTYQVLARKWRPQRFSELIGQGPIVQALQNGLTDGRIAQAYLFSGIRGVGKTTAARLLAKALNCEQGPTAEPCNECSICQEITSGADLDVIEVDAATYSKVEQVRDLTESLKYAPARDRYKVAVLDEIHRLSRQAFDALLKIVEEPPAHLVFVFATTEVDAVPATILSRCQEYRFRRVPIGELADHLANICQAEEITASPTALRLIARAGEGSVRDSVALLDQMATFGSGAIDDDEAARLIGGLDSPLQEELLRAIAHGDGNQIRQAVERLEEDGWDPRHAFAQFLAFCRDALHLAMKGKVDRTADEIERIGSLAQEIGYENLLRLIHHLLASETVLRRSEVPFLALEIAWLRAAELPKLMLLEDLIAGRPVAETAAPAGAATATAPTPARREPTRREPTRSREKSPEKPSATRKAQRPPARQPEPPPEPPPPHGDEEAPPELSSGPPPESLPDPAAAARAPKAPPTAPSKDEPAPDPTPSSSAGNLTALLEAVGARRQPLAAHLSEAQKLAVEDDVLVIYSPPGDPFLTKTLERPGNRKILEESIAAAWGVAMPWRLAEGDAVETPPEEVAKATAEAQDEVEANPAVQIVLDLFQGKVEEVEELENRPREES
ncbi:MAG: DNA polymerase III subunit gamma/tau [Acidobacteriota bacterium]